MHYTRRPLPDLIVPSASSQHWGKHPMGVSISRPLCKARNTNKMANPNRRDEGASDLLYCSSMTPQDRAASSWSGYRHQLPRPWRLNHSCPRRTGSHFALTQALMAQTAVMHQVKESQCLRQFSNMTFFCRHSRTGIRRMQDEGWLCQLGVTPQMIEICVYSVYRFFHFENISFLCQNTSYLRLVCTTSSIRGSTVLWLYLFKSPCGYMPSFSG